MFLREAGDGATCMSRESRWHRSLRVKAYRLQFLEHSTSPRDHSAPEASTARTKLKEYSRAARWVPKDQFLEPGAE